MLKDEIIKVIIEIDEQLAEIEEIYRPYEGRRIDSMWEFEVDYVFRLRDQADQLIAYRTLLRNELAFGYGIYIL